MKDVRFAKLLVLINCAVPAAVLVWDACHGQLGANPVNYAIRTTGLLALIFLLLSLLVTPASRLTGWTWLVHFRRTLGLFAFFHALVHFGLFFGLDRGLSISSTASEVVKRPYLGVGMIGLLLMAPLAATSTNAMVRRLGAKRWKALHRLAYFAAIAGVVHYYMQVKADVRQPIAFIAALTVLLGYRVVAHYLGLRSAYNKLRAATMAAPGLEGGREEVREAAVVRTADSPGSLAVLLTVSAPPAGAAKPRFWVGQLRVARVFQETPTVRTFRLVAADGGELPFDYLPGQYLNLALTIDGKKVPRSYTIASSPSRSGYCELTIKREEKGVASRHMHDTVREGDLLQVSGPAGRFTFTGAQAESIVLIAGGVGVTPLMAKLRYLTDRSWPGEIHFVFCVKDEAEIIFRPELEHLAARFPNLHLTVTLTRPSGNGWSGPRGRITGELLARVVPGLTGRAVRLCGPEEMMRAITGVLRELGVPAEKIETESFGPAKPGAGAAKAVGVAEPVAPLVSAPAAGPAPALTPAAVGGGLATVTFSRSGRTAQADGQTVLEAAEAVGIAIDFDCRAGICGTCKTKLLSGRVAMDVEDALDASDRERKLILACQARCVGPVTVEA